MAAGGRERLLRLFRPASRYREEMELEHGVESLEPLLFLLRRMLDVLCLRLAESWLVAAAMKLELGFDDKQRREASLRIAEPTRDVDLLLRLLHTHMEGVTAPAPIICIALELTPTRPAGSQMHIFERGMRDPNRFAETLAQIEAVVGSGNAGRVKLLPTRALDAFEMGAFLAEAKREARQAQALHARLPATPSATPAKDGVQAFCLSEPHRPSSASHPSRIRPVDVTLTHERPASCTPARSPTSSPHAAAPGSSPATGGATPDGGARYGRWRRAKAFSTSSRGTTANGSWKESSDERGFGFRGAACPQCLQLPARCISPGRSDAACRRARHDPPRHHGSRWCLRQRPGSLQGEGTRHG